MDILGGNERVASGSQGLGWEPRKKGEQKYGYSREKLKLEMGVRGWGGNRGERGSKNMDFLREN